MAIAVDLTKIKTADDKLAEAWDIVRKKRDKLLSACDWTQMSDNALSDDDKSSWQEYRQALRDITDQEDPTNVEWPESPNDA